MLHDKIASTTAPCANWRRHTDAPWVFLCVAILAVTCAVHYKAFCDDRTDLALPALLSSMTSECARLGPAVSAVAAPHEEALHPVATRIGVVVWVDRPAWAPAVHDALDRIDAALGAAASVVRVVRVAHPRETVEISQEAATAEGLAATAARQQLGLGAAQHVHAADGRRGELRMYGVSLFANPNSSPSPSSSSSSSPSSSSAPRCVAFAERQAFCAIADSDSREGEDVAAAIASLLARWLGLVSFRDTAALQAWAAARDVQSCRYAVRALRRLEQSVAEHPEMPAPDGIRETVERLQALIDARQFAELSRAADDLQFHPLLLPQLYIPWDHAMVNHMSILLPVFSMGLLAIRISLSARKKRRGEKKEGITAKEKNE